MALPLLLFIRMHHGRGRRGEKDKGLSLSIIGGKGDDRPR